MSRIDSSPPSSQPHNLLGRLDGLPLLQFHQRMSALMGAQLLFAGVDVVAIAILLPTILQVFRVPFSVVGALIGAVYLGQVVGSLSLGALSERFGRKRLLVYSLGAFGVLSFLTAFAPSFQALFVLRFLIGVPLGSMIPIITAYVSEYFPSEARGNATSGVLFLYTLGFVIAPFLLVFLLIPLFGQGAWRVLLGIGTLTLLLVPFIIWRAPESVRWLLHRGRIAEATKQVETLEAQAQDTGKLVSTPQLIQPPTERTRLGELFSARYRGRTALVWIRWFVGASILVGFASWLPTLETIVGLPPLQVQLLNIVFGIASLAVLAIYRFFVDRMGRQFWFYLGFGMAIVGASAGGLAFGLLHSTSWLTLFLSGLCMTMGGYVIVINNFLSTAELFPTRMRVWGLATSKCIDALASIAAPISIGILVASRAGIGAVFLLLLVLSLLAFGAEIVLGLETKREPLETLAQ